MIRPPDYGRSIKQSVARGFRRWARPQTALRVSVRVLWVGDGGVMPEMATRIKPKPLKIGERRELRKPAGQNSLETEP
jgi:hypothetical protein